MGALHRGHLSLIDRAKQENECVVVSIFVNPLQFGAGEDLEKYPRPFDRDRQLCTDAGVDAIFAPHPQEIGAEQNASGSTSNITSNITQVIPPAPMVDIMCGRSRPGHFAGVATIVTKLLQIVQPDRAYFGEKDGQQLAIIKKLIQDLNIPVEVIGCPTVREPDGLALSSRNQYLDPPQRAVAPAIYRALNQAKELFELLNVTDQDRLIQTVQTLLIAHPAIDPPIDIEYIELVDAITLESVENLADRNRATMLAIAARVGATRLIDNVLLDPTFAQIPSQISTKAPVEIPSKPNPTSPNRKPIIAIDGPAGAGKSTVAKLVARQLGLLYLDTGAMYRAIAWVIQEDGVEPTDEAAIANLARQVRIDLRAPAKAPDLPGQVSEPQVLVNGIDVTAAIRTKAVTNKVSAIAAQPAVREILVSQQQALGKSGGIVMEGRDIGTKVFPDAEIKVFLTASVQERAKRRHAELTARADAEPVDALSVIEAAIADRDHQDMTRAVSPLTKAEDAITIDTDGFSINDVVAIIVDLYNSYIENIEKVSSFHSVENIDPAEK